MAQYAGPSIFGAYRQAYDDEQRQRLMDLQGLSQVVNMGGQIQQQQFQGQMNPIQMQMAQEQLKQMQNPQPIHKVVGNQLVAIPPQGGPVTQAYDASPKFGPLGLIPNGRGAVGQQDTSSGKWSAVVGQELKGTQVDVRVDNKTVDSLAKEVGPIMSESRAGAMGAITAVDTVSRVKNAIDKGNVNLGPGATIKNKVEQFAQILGAAGNSTQERLVNTRNVIRGLSQFAVAARKQLKGQGQVSDYEGKLIQRAEAGEIDDFTLPELKDFIGVTDRLARKTYDEHKRLLGIMEGKDNLKQLAPFYSVPELSGAVGKPPAGISQAEWDAMPDEDKQLWQKTPTR